MLKCIVKNKLFSTILRIVIRKEALNHAKNCTIFFGHCSFHSANHAHDFSGSEILWCIGVAVFFKTISEAEVLPVEIIMTYRFSLELFLYIVLNVTLFMFPSFRFHYTKSAQPHPSHFRLKLMMGI